MATKTYICKSVPNLGIGADVRFHNGIFVTDNIIIQRRVERNEWYNRLIFGVELPVVESADDGDGEVVAGSTEESGDVFESLTDGPADPGYTSTQINLLKVGELHDLASDLGLEDHEDWSATTLKREIKLKLGL